MRPIPQFPLSAFPSLVFNATQELIRETGAPDDLVAASMLGAMSTATQWIRDVRLPHGPVRPTSLNLITLADRGDRKSTVDKYALKRHYELAQKTEALAIQRAQDIQTECELWHALRKRFVTEISKLELAGETTDELRARLKQHEATKPTTPRTAGLMLSNATTRAFLDAIEGDDHIVALVSDEGETMISGPIFSSSGVLNQAWDGSPMIALHRANGDSVIARNPRVSVLMMVQPDVWQRLMNSTRGKAMYGTGFCARMLICLVASNQGYRPPPSMTSYDGPIEFYDWVDKVARTYLDRLQSKVPGKLEVLELHREAKTLLHGHLVTMEPELAPGRVLHDTRDFASKFGEQVCRVAASLHTFSPANSSLLIPAETVCNAIDIVSWFGNHFVIIFNPCGPLSPLASDAQKLLNYVQRQYWGIHQVARLSVIGREGPIRGKSHIMACVEYLVRHQMARLVTAPSHGQTLQPPGFSIGVV